MELSLSTWMMIIFIIALIIGIWKIYVFLPNRALPDDDTTKEATQELESLMIHAIVKHKGSLDQAALFDAIRELDGFDRKRFWRFNRNRLEHLLNRYYLLHPKIDTIEGIYLNEK
ncbi:MAG: hypothetical protein IE916_04140 [Epsilonproteobacteria bacterium]|nr:hypothetical protein [Campylobacterota bacterium]